MWGLLKEGIIALFLNKYLWKNPKNRKMKMLSIVFRPVKRTTPNCHIEWIPFYCKQFFRETFLFEKGQKSNTIYQFKSASFSPVPAQFTIYVAIWIFAFLNATAIRQINFFDVQILIKNWNTLHFDFFVIYKHLLQYLEIEISEKLLYHKSFRIYW
jgi:hypothetical protein